MITVAANYTHTLHASSARVLEKGCAKCLKPAKPHFENGKGALPH